MKLAALGPNPAREMLPTGTRNKPINGYWAVFVLVRPKHAENYNRFINYITSHHITY